MNIPCPECHRKFGGTETFERHFVRREDRCKRIKELLASGMRKDQLGVWRRIPPTKQTAVLPGLERSGSNRRRATQDPSPAPSTSPHPSVDSVGPPTDATGGAA